MPAPPTTSAELTGSLDLRALASWLQDQSYSLIQPNGDAFNAQEYFY